MNSENSFLFSNQRQSCKKIQSVTVKARTVPTNAVTTWRHAHKSRVIGPLCAVHRNACHKGRWTLWSATVKLPVSRRAVSTLLAVITPQRAPWYLPVRSQSVTAQHCATAWLVHRYHLQKLIVSQLLKEFYYCVHNPPSILSHFNPFYPVSTRSILLLLYHLCLCLPNVSFLYVAHHCSCKHLSFP